MCGPQRSAPREEALAAAGSGHMIQVTLSGQTWQPSDVEQANPAVESIVLSGTRLSNEQMGPRGSSAVRKPSTGG